MTLDTRILVTSEINVHDLFRHGQEVLAAFDAQHRTPDQQIYTDGPVKEWAAGESFDAADGRRRIANNLGQGLPGILKITYKADGPLRVDGEHGLYCDNDEEPCDGTNGWCHPCWAVISIDTAYGYQDAYGGCGHLHARMILLFGQWMEERGATWKWVNEFDGAVHDGYDNLEDLIGGSVEADRWLRQQVLPAPSAHIASEG